MSIQKKEKSAEYLSENSDTPSYLPERIMCPEDIRPVNKKEKMVDNLTDRDYNKSH